MRVEHPFHPLHGREIVVVDKRRSRHGDRVWYEADDGSTHTLPLAWTSLADPHPFELISAGRARFHTEDLLRLAALIDDVRRQESKPDDPHEL